MCGIGGFVDYERDARRGGPILHGMKRTLTPRGPDAEGTYFDEDAALVHRRLIVIDPEGGKQPMHSPDRNTIIIYNGELYNTPKLRTELMSRGHEFVGHSDTEVLLHAYLEWKTDAFARLNGIFAFAIWEKRERRLTLCRDRLGVKPLFFAPIRNGLTPKERDNPSIINYSRKKRIANRRSSLRSTRMVCALCCCSGRRARRNPVFSGR